MNEGIWMRATRLLAASISREREVRVTADNKQRGKPAGRNGGIGVAIKYETFSPSLECVRLKQEFP